MWGYGQELGREDVKAKSGDIQDLELELRRDWWVGTYADIPLRRSVSAD